MDRVVDRLAAFLSAPPDAAVGSAAVGARQPATSGDLPALVIGLRIDDVKGLGLGGFVRQGHTPTQSTTTIEVGASEETFTPGLQTLRISPLPLVRNPTASGSSFSEADIQLRNSTDPANPREYQLSDNPTRADQFRVVPSRGEIVFGRPQTAGDRLEVVHWTLTWREDIRAERFSGRVTLEAWASSFADLNGIVQRSLAKLRGAPEALRQQGFQRLVPAGLSPASQARWEPAIGTAVLVCRQLMEFRFTAEIEQGGEISSGGVIRRIDVAMDDTVDEQFSIP
jgi:hypothetical protein